MSFLRYPRYRASGVEWLGDVPEHWDLKRLKFCLRLVTEKAESRTRAVALENIESWTGRLVEGEGEYDGDGVAFVEGDLIFGKLRPYLAKVHLADRSGEAVGDFHVCRPVKGVHGRYALRYMLNPAFISTVDGSTYGAKMPRVSWDFMADLPFPIPPEIDQHAIASFLDRETAKIDALVEEQKRLIDLLKEKRQAVITQAVTKGLNPNAPMKPSGIEWLGDIPSHWTIRKLGHVAFMQEGPGLRNWQFTDSGTRVICVTNITESGIDFDRYEKFISPQEYAESYRHFTVSKGDLLLSSSGNSWGKVAVFDGDEEVILNTSTIRLNEKDNALMSVSYLFYLLMSPSVREQLALAMTGACQPNFGPSHLSEVLVPVPTAQEQQSIVKKLFCEIGSINNLVSEAERATLFLLERRSAVISAAVTGGIDVRSLVRAQVEKQLEPDGMEAA
ncbi:restriction endonuclease subunit S [Hyphomonas sp.]|uniref:restriction endonuclease subunit S n=1 Tax=Hyphomonas sp. TaxID=87 RepID=UPI0025BDC829|nr:restriction endonuclease subunit S [Hyphomonas sp.]